MKELFLLLFICSSILDSNTIINANESSNEIKNIQEKIDKHKEEINKLQNKLNELKPKDEIINEVEIGSLKYSVSMETTDKVEEGNISFEPTEGDTFLILKIKVFNELGEAVMVNEDPFTLSLLEKEFMDTQLIGMDTFIGNEAIPEDSELDFIKVYELDEAIIKSKDLMLIIKDGESVVEEINLNKE